MQTKRLTRFLGAALSLAGLLVLAACGGGNVTFTADTSKQLQLVAGSTAGQGVADGDAATARFGQPRRISVNAAGMVFMLDTSCRFIRIQDGVTTTLATTSLCDTVHGLISVSQMVGRSDGSLLVVLGDSAIYRIATDGSVATVFDFADGSLLYGLAVGPDNAYYVMHVSSDETVCAVMRVADSGGTLAASVYAAGGACGTADGPPGTGQINPGIVARLQFAPSGELYALDSQKMRWIMPDGTLYTIPATYPQPLQSMTVTATGGVYVSLQSDDELTLNTSSQGGTIWRLTADGTLIFVAGQPGPLAAADGTGAAGTFGYPGDISADADGNLWVADDFAYAVRKVTPAGVVTTPYGSLPQFGAVDARGAAARFSAPESLAVDAAGNIFVGDYGNCELRKIDPTGVVSTLAGTATGCTYDNMGVEDTHTFGAIANVVADGDGGLFVSDGCAIRKVSASGVISAFVGSRATCALVDGSGTNASLGYVASMAVDGKGNLYAMDYTNDVVRKVTPAGIVTTLAGTVGVTGHTDGPGVAAVFGQMAGLAADAAGNVYVSEYDNHDIRRIDPAGVVSTLAGSPAIAGNADGTGAAATFATPGMLATTPDGSVVVYDQGWDVGAQGGAGGPVVPMSLRLVKADGSVSTILSNANITDYGVVTGKTPRLNFVSGIAVDADGNILMTMGNAVLRYGVGQ